MYLVYSALLGVVLVLGLPYWLFRTLRHSKRHIGLAERLGKVPDGLARHRSRPAIWVHAVSVGELIAVSDLITALTRRFPAYRLVVFVHSDVGWGEAEVKDVASNRRVMGPDGKVKAVRYTATKDAALRAEPIGTIDPIVSLVSFWNGERPVAVLSYYATHPQSYYRTGIPNPDFPGIARFFGSWLFRRRCRSISPARAATLAPANTTTARRRTGSRWPNVSPTACAAPGKIPGVNPSPPVT